MCHLYHVYLTTEHDTTGGIVYWAAYREVPWQAPGATREEALAKLVLYARAYVDDCIARGIVPKPFVSRPQVFDWTSPEKTFGGSAPEN